MLDRLNTRIREMEYGWTKPASLVTLVPGVAWYVEIVKLRAIDHHPRSLGEMVDGSNRVSQITIPHILGAFARIVALGALRKLTGGHKWVTVPILSAICQVAYSGWSGQRTFKSS